MEKYNPQKIEKKWQEKWEEQGLYKTKDKSEKPKFYALDMFPYISGSGIHVGHPKGYIATDVVSRFKMLNGFEVLHPMGWDAFGLPAENYAIKNKINPNIFVKEHIDRFRSQLKTFGFTYDWDREFSTTDPEYYKWTQWIFLKLFEKGLAFESKEPVNWCPKCKTVLANEDLEKGLCERCGTEVVQKKLRQWVLKMTDYADRLLYDLDSEGLDWEELIKEQQRNWIGRSEGVLIKFPISNLAYRQAGFQTNPDDKNSNGQDFIEVYTTRVDTIYGCTYCVLAPEHSIIEKLKDKIENYSEVEKYVIKAQNKTELERTQLQKDKTGVELKGIKVVNPFTKENIPLFVGDYVLGFYGTGAVMAVPAHDERDFEFARKYNLEIKDVIAPYLKDDPRDDKKTEKRDVVTAIVKNPKNNTYLCLDWKTTKWRSFPTGGIDGEDFIEAAKREVKEETGYRNIKFIKRIGDSIFAEFYRPHKDSNVFAHFKYLLFELEDETRSEVLQKEKDQHEAVWIKEEEIELYINVWNQKIAWRRYRTGNFAYINDGILINSGEYNGLFSKEVREKMADWLEKKGIGKKKINYKMRDWIFSRQRYWGEPIPIIHCEKCGAVPVPEKDLPVTLPDVENYEPTGTGESPLANIKEWLNVKCPKCGGEGRRETNTMPQWAGSCWYYLRYIDPKNKKSLIDKNKEKYWIPVDLYVGGAEHATRHLLYARFWHKFLFDIGAVSTKEPFKKLVHVGLINAEDGRKMSKRWGNVVNPDDVIFEFGADSLRLYEMFMGPFSQAISWSTAGVSGMKRFLEKVWKLYASMEAVEKQVSVNNKTDIMFNKTIKKVEEDIENFRFNTAISSLMILVNELEKQESVFPSQISILCILLSPFAPHIAEELWEKMQTNMDLMRTGAESDKKHSSIFEQSWPKYNPELIKDEEIELVIQVNGKLRDRIKVPADISEDDAKKAATESEKVKSFIGEKEMKKIIFVKGKLVNIVI